MDGRETKAWFIKTYVGLHEVAAALMMMTTINDGIHEQRKKTKTNTLFFLANVNLIGFALYGNLNH